MCKRNYFNPKSAICNNIIFYKFPTFTISFVLCMIFTCNPSGFRKFRSLHIQFVELEQNMMQQLGLHEAPTNNLKNIMVVTALSNIPDVRQEVCMFKPNARPISISWSLDGFTSYALENITNIRKIFIQQLVSLHLDDFNSIGWKWGYIFGVIYRIPEVVNNTAAGRNSTATLIYRYLRQLFFFQKLNNVVHYLQNNFLSTQWPVYLVLVIKRMFLVLAD